MNAMKGRTTMKKKINRNAVCSSDNNTIYDYGTKFLSKKTIRFMPTFIQKYDNKSDQERTFYYNLNGDVDKTVKEKK